MKVTTSIPLLTTVLGLALAQSTNDTNNLQLPSMHPCADGYTYGTDTVIFRTPYTYAQVMSIIGSFRNITWSGSPYDTVTLNGTDNTVGTARTYDIVGAHVIETIDVYSKPPYPGPYDEVHSLLPLTIPTLNLSFFGDYDGTTVTPICNGAASEFNFTINFCSNNATAAAATLHSIHMGDAQTVGVFLGGLNFSTCEAIVYGAGGSNATNGTGVTPYKGGADGMVVSSGVWTLMMGAVALAAFL